MNDVQKKLLEIAKEYIRVCELLNLRYFAVGGTCLGAVRHHGFIPWDDDMDFAMPREDYNIFCKKGPKLLQNNFFIQTQKYDKNFFHPFCKLRDSMTTMIEDNFKNINVNQGCWIDVFPLDGIPLKKNKKMKYRSVALSYYRLLLSYLGGDSGFGRPGRLISTFFNRIYLFRKEVYRFRNYYISKNKYCKSENVWWNWAEKDSFVLKKDWLGIGVKVSFEDITIPIPEKYNLYLASHYGDWEMIPSLEDRKPSHNCFVDLENSYIKYRGILYFKK